MADEQNEKNLTSRPPTVEDLLKICRALNEARVRYVVLGGMAINQLGLFRGTSDIDLLLDDSEENVDSARKALACLHDHASLEVRPSDVREYTVVRVNDEITVDLMGAACGIKFAEANSMIEWIELENVRIPFASARLLWKTKQTYREKDNMDRIFLRKLLEE